MESMKPPLNPPELLNDLHRAENRIHEILGALLPEELGPQCKIATPQQLSELLAALMRAGQCLHAATGCSDIDLQKETQSYRKEVERLQTVLPSLQAALVAERERLQEQRNRVSTTAAWAQASRETIQR